MTGRPITFSDAMVRALLSGRKTQSRRVLSPQPVSPLDSITTTVTLLNGRVAIFRNPFTDYRQDVKLPHVAGDTLYVREALRLESLGSGTFGPLVYSADNKTVPLSKIPDSFFATRSYVPPIHAPKWSSRITLEVTDVRVQRLQDISVDDVVAEGIDLEDGEGARLFSEAEHIAAVGGSHGCTSAEIYPFATLWDSLHAKTGHTWDTNPWVVAYTFEREKGKPDDSNL